MGLGPGYKSALSYFLALGSQSQTMTPRAKAVFQGKRCCYFREPERQDSETSRLLRDSVSLLWMTLKKPT